MLIAPVFDSPTMMRMVAAMAAALSGTSPSLLEIAAAAPTTSPMSAP